jgi:hypothetical protein
MENRLGKVKTGGWARKVTARLSPSNADRAAWAASAIAAFAVASGASGDLPVDPETVLGDLLADLMHWSDLRGARLRVERPISFDLALTQARVHYVDERVSEQKR